MNNVAATITRKQYQGTAARLLNFLGIGMKQEQAAEACGVTASFVSQLWDDPEFREQVEIQRLKGVSDGAEIDNNYIETEKLLAKRLLTVAATISDPDKVIRVLKYVNEAKRKVPSSLTSSDNGGTTQTVRLVLPPIIQQNFLLNPNREVIEVGNQKLVTMTPESLRKLAAESAEKAAAQLKVTTSQGNKHAIEQL